MDSYSSDEVSFGMNFTYLSNLLVDMIIGWCQCQSKMSSCRDGG